MGKIWTDAESLAADVTAWRLSCPRDRLVFTSGGFDCLHVGHARCLRAASLLGRRLAVAVNGDGFLLRKKGYVFMPLAERMEIVAALEGVDDVFPWDDGSQFVDGAVLLLKPDVFAKGGDRSRPEDLAPAELSACAAAGCRVAYGVGGSDKPQSSSSLVAAAAARAV